MDIKNHITWLEKNNLLGLAKQSYPLYKNVLQTCLDLKKEQVLIITDKGHQDRCIAPLMSLGYYLAAKELGLDVNLVSQEPKYRGDNADDNVVEALDKLPQGSLVILNLSGRLGSIGQLGDSYRGFIRQGQHKFISAPSLGEVQTNKYQQVIDSINIDYNKLSKSCNHVKDILDSGDEVHVTTDAGTDFYYRIKGKDAIPNSGIFNSYGGNIPAGETYIPPKGKKGVYGKVVIDGTMSYKHGSWLLKDPITLIVENGTVVDIQGDEGALLLKHTLSWAEEKAKHSWGVRRVCEFGIGLNTNAKIIGATIVDEKAYNTAHIALGSNHWFGGTIYAIIHLDQVFRNPKIFVDDEELKI